MHDPAKATSRLPVPQTVLLPPGLAALLAGTSHWIVLLAALVLAQQVALPLSAWVLGSGVPWWLPLAVGLSMRALQGPVARTAGLRTRPRIVRCVAQAALGRSLRGVDAEVSEEFLAVVLLDQSLTAKLPALIGQVLALLLGLSLAATVVPLRYVLLVALAGALALALRLVAGRPLRRRLEEMILRRRTLGAWLAASVRGRAEVDGAARRHFLDSIVGAATRWASTEADYQKAGRRVQILQFAVFGAALVAGLALLGASPRALLDTVSTRASLGGLRGGIVLMLSLAPAISLARSVEDLVYSLELSRSVLGRPAAPGRTQPLPAQATAACLHDVTVRFGEQVALDGATLEIPFHGVTAVVGPNGAGKSTLAHVVAGTLAPDAGTCTVGDVPTSRLDPAGIALVPQQPCLIDLLTVGENLRLVVPEASDHDLLGALAAAGLRVPLEHSAGALSRGEQRRIAVARAVLRPARLLVLDEPDSWLDRSGRDVLRALLQREGAQRGVLLVTHRADLVSWVDRVVVLAADHRVEVIAPPGEIAARSPTWKALIAGAADEALRFGAGAA